MNRRDFLLSSVVLPTVAAAAEKEKAKGAVDPWQEVRAQFELAPGKVNTVLFLLASHPKAVREAIERHRRALDADPVSYVMDQHEPLDTKVSQAAAAYLDVKPEEIALTDSTTMGLGLVYGTLRFEPGQEVLTTTHDHYSTQLALEHRKARDGITVKTVGLYDAPEGATAAKMVDAVVKAVTPKTRLVAITWVHSCSGVRTPVRAIADALQKLNQGRAEKDRVLLCVDGVHGLAACETSLPKLGCDIFIAGTHKWLFGPRGTGLVWMKSDVWPLMQPMIPTFSGGSYPMWMGVIPARPLPPCELNTPGGFHSFEHRWALADAFAWHASLGKAKVQARIHALNRQAKEALVKMKHVKLHTPLADELSAGMVTFSVEGIPEEAVVKRLLQKNIVASITPYKAPRYARVSFGILNSPDDVEQVVKAVNALAAA